MHRQNLVLGWARKWGMVWLNWDLLPSSKVLTLGTPIQLCNKLLCVSAIYMVTPRCLTLKVLQVLFLFCLVLFCLDMSLHMERKMVRPGETPRTTNNKHVREVQLLFSVLKRDSTCELWRDEEVCWRSQLGSDCFNSDPSSSSSSVADGDTVSYVYLRIRQEKYHNITSHRVRCHYTGTVMIITILI